jgi:hypothetical protein
VLDALGFGAVNYQSLKVELERTTLVIKGGKPPSDARIIEYTWQYVNRRGGPDRRFGNNPQFPVIEVGEVKFSSDSGFQSILKFSNVGRAEALVNGIRQFAAVAATDRR